MPTLHLMVGLPCSGKTTEARRLAEVHRALVLTPDVWHLQLFGQDALEPSHDGNHTKVEKIMWDVARRVLELGTDVVLDFGFWAEVERTDFRQRAAALGAQFRLHYMEVPRQELLGRLAERNRRAPEGVFIIPEPEMLRYMEIFQPPTQDELYQ